MTTPALQPFGPEHAWGGVDVFDADPTVEEVRDAYYLPYAQGAGWGLFDRDDRILMSSVDLVFPEGMWMEQSPDSPVRASAIPDRAPEPVYLYGGRFNHNYGHFLVDVLSRYWTLADQRGAKPKILVHHPDPQDYLARYPFARLFFAALGLAPEDFVAFDRPVRLERVIVPWTSFRHQTHAHRAYARLGRRIGEAMLAGRTPRPSDRPVYLSKTGLTAGIRRFINEAEVERELAANGVDILRPEALPLPEQIALFAERPAVIGMAGSGFHNSLFAPSVCRLVLLSPKVSINSNFVLFDRLTGADSLYCHVTGARMLEHGGSFHRAFEIDEPRALAHAILDLL